MAKYPKFEERYCAFVDILGFRQLIDRLDRNQIKFQLVRKLLRTIQGPSQDRPYLFDRADFRAQSISDAIALSAKPKIEGLWQLLYSLDKLSLLSFWTKGTSCAALIVKGKLYHDDQIVFGSALVRAYELESTVVNFPRPTCIPTQHELWYCRRIPTLPRNTGSYSASLERSDRQPQALRKDQVVRFVLE